MARALFALEAHQVEVNWQCLEFERETMQMRQLPMSMPHMEFEVHKRC